MSDSAAVAASTAPCSLDFGLGINNLFASPFTTGGATASWADRLVTLKAGPSAGSVVAMESRMLLKLNHSARQDTCYNVRFDPPVAGRESWAGLGTPARGACVGYRGADFGMLVQRDGCREYAKLTIDDAPSASGQITVTFAGRSASIPVAQGMTRGQVVAVVTYSSAWREINVIATSECDRIELQTFEAAAYLEDPPSVDFGSTGMTGFIARSRGGCDATEDFTHCASFNGGGYAGLGELFDPQRWMVYRLRFDAWGSGGIELAVQHPQSPEFVLLHTWRPAAVHDRFDTSVPYCTVVRSLTTADTDAPDSGLVLAGGSTSTGIPATAGLRSRYHRRFAKDSVPLSANGETALGVLCSPVIQEGGIRNTGIATVCDVAVVVRSPVDVIVSAVVGGVASAPFPCARYMPWTCLNAADALDTVLVNGGLRLSSAFVAAGNTNEVRLQCDQMWILPGSWVAFTVMPARASDSAAVVDTAALGVVWFET